VTPIVCVVGRSKSGKTTFIEGLLPELMRRGYRVATIKHTHASVQTNAPFKDSIRHEQAGAQIALLSTPRKILFTERVAHDASLETLANRYVRDVDLILAEGFKRDKYPKIEVFTSRVHPRPLAPGLSNVRALITDDKLDLDIPCFARSRVQEVATFIEHELMNGMPATGTTFLKVNGKPIPLSDFPEEMLVGAVRGMVSSLKGCESPGEIEITLRFNGRR
jgi:molybdopterin-guanine dinucleotide biosynthesis protein B